MHFRATTVVVVVSPDVPVLLLQSQKAKQK